MTSEPSPPLPPGRGGGDEVAEEWKRRVRAEYHSAALAAHVTLGLIRTGAPAELIRAGLRVVDDELTHSELSWEVAVAAGAERPVTVDADVLTVADGPDRLGALALAMARYFCVGETVAVPLFRMLRRHATAPPAQRALDAILRDEGRHRQFGWDVLDWLLTMDEGLAATVAATLPAMLDDARTAYASQPDAPPLAPQIAEWGMASPSEYAEVLAGTLERDVVPRFAARGIEVAPAASASSPG